MLVEVSRQPADNSENCVCLCTGLVGGVSRMSGPCHLSLPINPLPEGHQLQPPIFSDHCCTMDFRID